MLSEKERVFMEYWETHRLREKKTFRQFVIGIPVGLLFAIPVILLLFSGRLWYKRAMAEADTQTSPVVIIIAVLLIAAFVAIFYKKHLWDMKEQQYLQIKAREEALKSKESNPS